MEQPRTEIKVNDGQPTKDMVISYMCERTRLPTVLSVYFRSRLGETQGTQETRPCGTINVAISRGEELDFAA